MTLVGTSVIPTGVFSYIVGTYDGKIAKLYVNGGLQSSLTVSGTLKKSDAPVVIGNAGAGCRASFSGLVEFEGLIDEAAIYNRSLTAEEVANIFNAGSVGKCKNQNPIAKGKNVIIGADRNCEGHLTAEEVDDGSNDPDGDLLIFELIPPGPYPLGETEATLVVNDNKGGYDSCNVFITVENSAVEVGIIVAPTVLSEADSIINVSAEFVDEDLSQTHTVIWDWGDESEITIQQIIDGSRIVHATHTYFLAGVYTVTLVIKDNCGAFEQTSFEYIVIYDAGAGFVTGGGWIESPAGAYVVDPTLTGKANFGFVSKYEKGATTPSGQTEFNFKVADLNFHSSEYQWLVIAGPKAMFKGIGTINNEGNYGFLLSAIDGEISGGGGVDKFRIKIWDKDDGEAIVYDNQMDAAEDADLTTAIGGGNIVIHKESVKKGGDLAEGMENAIPTEYELYQNYPNPFNPETVISYDLPEPVHVILEIYNITGNKVITLANAQLAAGSHSIVWNGRDQSGLPIAGGVYLYRIRAGQFKKTMRMLYLK
ncbi:T9SS type A sorting domain-containing protein [candidate division KSB1 bacterium]|nr:T9SS type A sorting domain-containing protein [candidate division KSB1 bacterium]